MFESLITLLFLLIAGHMLADFALQNDWVATNKNRHARDKYNIDEQDKMEKIWPWLLTAHCFHHGLLVFLFTQKLSLGILETIVHWLIDFGKSENYYGFHTDQVLHIVSKVVWISLLYYQIV